MNARVNHNCHQKNFKQPKANKTRKMRQLMNVKIGPPAVGNNYDWE